MRLRGDEVFILINNPWIFLFVFIRTEKKSFYQSGKMNYRKTNTAREFNRQYAYEYQELPEYSRTPTYMDTDDLNLPSPSNQMLMFQAFNSRHYDADAYSGQCSSSSSSNSGRSSTPSTDVAATTPSIKPKKGERWSNKEEEVLVGAWKENYETIKTSKLRGGWNNVLRL